MGWGGEGCGTGDPQGRSLTLTRILTLIMVQVTRKEGGEIKVKVQACYFYLVMNSAHHHTIESIYKFQKEVIKPNPNPKLKFQKEVIKPNPNPKLNPNPNLNANANPNWRSVMNSI